MRVTFGGKADGLVWGGGQVAEGGGILAARGGHNYSSSPVDARGGAGRGGNSLPSITPQCGKDVSSVCVGGVGFEVGNGVDIRLSALLVRLGAGAGERVQLLARRMPFAPSRKVTAGHAHHSLRWRFAQDHAEVTPTTGQWVGRGK